MTASEKPLGCERRALVRSRIKRVIPAPEGCCFINVPSAEEDMVALCRELKAYHDKHNVTRDKAASILRAETLPSLEELGIIQLEEATPTREETLTPQPQQQDELVHRWFIHDGRVCLYGDSDPEDALAVVKIYRDGPVLVCCRAQDIRRAKDFALCCINLETERKTVKPKILKEEDFE